MLKSKYAKLEDIPDGATAFYLKVGEEYILQAEATKDGEELKRTSALLTTERDKGRELEAKLGQLGGIDVNKISELVELHNTLGDDFDASTFDSMKTELGTLKANRNADLATLQDQLVDEKRNRNQVIKENGTIKKKLEMAETGMSGLQNQINQTTIHTELRRVALDLKVEPPAVDDVLMHAGLFELDQKGQVVAKDGLPNMLTGTPPEEWLTTCKATKTHWWKPSISGGGTGGAGGAFTGKNPWKADSRNLTDQGKIFQENPELARSLAKEAGVPLP